MHIFCCRFPFFHIFHRNPIQYWYRLPVVCLSFPSVAVSVRNVGCHSEGIRSQMFLIVVPGSSGSFCCWKHIVFYPSLTVVLFPFFSSSGWCCSGCKNHKRLGRGEDRKDITIIFSLFLEEKVSPWFSPYKKAPIVRLASDFGLTVDLISSSSPSHYLTMLRLVRLLLLILQTLYWLTRVSRALIWSHVCLSVVLPESSRLPSPPAADHLSLLCNELPSLLFSFCLFAFLFNLPSSCSYKPFCSPSQHTHRPDRLLTPPWPSMTLLTSSLLPFPFDSTHTSIYTHTHTYIIHFNADVTPGDNDFTFGRQWEKRREKKRKWLQALVSVFSKSTQFIPKCSSCDAQVANPYTRHFFSFPSWCENEWMRWISFSHLSLQSAKWVCIG